MARYLGDDNVALSPAISSRRPHPIRGASSAARRPRITTGCRVATGRGGVIARRGSIAAPYLRPGQVEEHLIYPVTTGAGDHPGGYDAAMADFYQRAADRIAAHLHAGRDVALLAEGDPLFYSSYMHLHVRLTERFNAVIVPGVTSISAASAAGSTRWPGVLARST